MNAFVKLILFTGHSLTYNLSLTSLICHATGSRSHTTISWITYTIRERGVLINKSLRTRYINSINFLYIIQLKMSNCFYVSVKCCLMSFCPCWSLEGENRALLCSNWRTLLATRTPMRSIHSASSGPGSVREQTLKRAHLWADCLTDHLTRTLRMQLGWGGGI